MGLVRQRLNDERVGLEIWMDWESAVISVWERANLSV